MATTHAKTTHCPGEAVLSAYLDGTLKGAERKAAEEHIASCEDCLTRIVAAHEAVAAFTRTRKGTVMKKINWYLAGTLISFILSFALPRYFVQFLVATVLLGMKWIVDAKNTRILVMIYDAWRKGGEKEAAKVLEGLNADPSKGRF